MVALCEAADVWSVISSGSVPNGGRLCSSALAASDVFELDCHGFATDTPIRFRTEDGGAFPGGITAGTTYYAIPIDESRFQAAASAGGAAVSMLSDGELVVVMRDRPVNAAILMASAHVAPALRGNAEPASLAEVPYQVRSLVALYAARILRVWSERDHADLAPLVADAEKRLDKFMRGIPTGGPDATAPSNLAIARSGWRTAGVTRDTEVLP